MKVTIEVEMDIEPTEQERTDSLPLYEPTPEAPEPDEEWLLEEIAMSRLGRVVGVLSVTCIDSESKHSGKGDTMSRH